MAELTSYEGPRRREGDVITGLLSDRIGAVERVANAANSDTLSRLDGHIAKCEDNQRWIIRGLIGLCAWVVLHSPEVLGLGAKILDAAKP